MASNAAQTQSINIADLEVPQLAEVRRQLEEVLSPLQRPVSHPGYPLNGIPLGTQPPIKFICPTA